MNAYASLDDLHESLGMPHDAGDTRLLDVLRAASRLIERHAGRRFYPQRATRIYPYTHPTLLPLRDDLLALHGLTNGDGSAIPLDAVRLVPDDSAVHAALSLDRRRCTFTYRDDPAGALTVEGTWGCHPEWPDAWAPSGDAVQGGLDAVAAVIAVADADGAAVDGRAPRFSAGQLLRVGEEYLHVLAVDPVQDRLTVLRGANGTRAADHSAGAALDVYRPPADVRQACLRVALWLLKQRDAGFAQSAGSLRGTIVVPPALPEDVAQILGPLVRVRVA